MKITVKQLKDLIQDLSDEQELDFVGLFKIEYTKKVELISCNIISNDDSTTSIKIVDDAVGLGNDIFYNESKKAPTSLHLHEDIMNLLGWKDDNSTKLKLQGFVTTLLKIWNPYTRLDCISRKDLNATTFSKALFVCRHKLKVADKVKGIDTIIDNFIIDNIEYIKNKYNKECRN